jgi:uroporphyrin-III C-methyltransferase
LSRPGKVFLVGAGPGDPELLTLKAAKVLRSADVVLHDELVSPEILRLIPPTAELVNVGKRCGRKSMPQEETNRLLVDYALLGFEVVRLKGGDPFIFGRGGEEIERLRLLGIEVEVVPGITAALGAAARAQIPLTHRQLSSTVILLTGSSQHSVHTSSWPERLPANATVVVYMPGHDLSVLQQRLLASGVAGETPCALISSATSEREQVHLTTTSQLAHAPCLSAPKLLVVGEVVRLADSARFEEFSEFARSADYAETSSSTRENAQ